MDAQHLPGDLGIEEKLERLIRVNHAGEYGALRIYQGQLAVLKGTSCEEVLQEMLDQEKVHFAYFDTEMKKRRVRPTVLSPLWHGLGFALGALTARLGEKAAMACTVAVEDAIDDHYRAQEEMLESVPQEYDLKEKITQFRIEEQEHKQIGITHGARQTPGYHLVYHAIKNASRAAIWLSSRL